MIESISMGLPSTLAIEVSVLPSLTTAPTPHSTNTAMMSEKMT